jgi:hypothetical protein
MTCIVFKSFDVFIMNDAANWTAQRKTKSLLDETETWSCTRLYFVPIVISQTYVIIKKLFSVGCMAYMHTDGRIV